MDLIGMILVVFSEFNSRTVSLDEKKTWENRFCTLAAILL